MKSPKTRTPKYRPSLTGNNILKILELAKTEVPISSESTSLIAALDRWRFNIENDLAAISHTSSPRTTLEDSLGIYRIPESSLGSTDPENTFLTKEQRWKAAYNLYLNNPAECSLTELSMACEHRYLNNLMTTEEMQEFEKSPADSSPHTGGIGNE